MKCAGNCATATVILHGGDVLEKRVQKLARRSAALFVLLLALALVGDRAYLLWMGSSSEGWPQVDGTIQSFSYKEVGQGRAGEGWRLSVEYSYQVDGQEIHSDRLRFSKRFAGLDDEALADARRRYAEDARVTVYHHPGRPALSVLEPGMDSQAWLGLVLGFVLILIAVVFWTVPTHSGRGRRGPGPVPRQ